MKILTLEGLKTSKLSEKHSKCETVKAYSPVLDQEVIVCKDALDHLPNQLPGSLGRRGRGRPKGSTVKRGARRPRVTECTRTKIVKTKSGKMICKCDSAGNSRILPHSRCRLEKGNGGKNGT